MERSKFISQPKYSSLTNKEKNLRWRQHRASMGNTFTRKVDNTTGLAVSALVHTFPPCAIHYLQALEDPFHLTAPACIPDLYAIPSKKFKGVIKQSFQTGGNGKGYCIFAPHVKCNNRDLVIATNATYAASTIVTAGTTVDEHKMLMIPYADTAFADAVTPGVHARVVGQGARIRYTGPEISRSGTITAFREPDNNNLGGLTIEEIRTALTAKSYPVSREWIYINYRPTNPDEYQYSTSARTPNNGGASQNWSLGFILTGVTDSTGAPGSGSFEFQVISHIEYVGSAIDTMTHTHSDINAMSQIRNVASLTSSTMNPHKNLAQAAQAIGSNILQHSAPAVAESIKGSETHSIMSSLYNVGQSAVGSVGSYMLGSSIVNGASSIYKSLGSGFAEAMPWLSSLSKSALPFIEEALPTALSFL